MALGVLYVLIFSYFLRWQIFVFTSDHQTLEVYHGHQPCYGISNHDIVQVLRAAYEVILLNPSSIRKKFLTLAGIEPGTLWSWVICLNLSQLYNLNHNYFKVSKIYQQVINQQRVPPWLGQKIQLQKVVGLTPTIKVARSRGLLYVIINTLIDIS